MKQVFISYPVSWIMGYLRYGHREGTLEMTDEEFKEFSADPVSWLTKDYNYFKLKLLVDDFRIEDYDKDIQDVEWSEC